MEIYVEYIKGIDLNLILFTTSIIYYTWETETNFQLETKILLVDSP